MECGLVGDIDFSYSRQVIRVVQHVSSFEDRAYPSPVVWPGSRCTAHRPRDCPALTPGGRGSFRHPAATSTLNSDGNYK